MYWSISSKEPLSIRVERVEIRPVGEVNSLRIVEKVSVTSCGVTSIDSLANAGCCWVVKMSVVAID